MFTSSKIMPRAKESPIASLQFLLAFRAGVVGVYLLLLAIPLAQAGETLARKVFAGPVRAEVLAVIDGDSIRVRVPIWLDQDLVTSVRIRGIDAPELRGRCAREKHLARRARAYVRAATGAGIVVLTNISRGKYYGRVIADVTTREGYLLSARLLRKRLARRYRAGRRRTWC